MSKIKITKQHFDNAKKQLNQYSPTSQNVTILAFKDNSETFSSIRSIGKVGFVKHGDDYVLDKENYVVL